MARLFDDAKSQYLENASAVLSGVPATMVAWMRPDAAVASQAVGVYDVSAADQWMDLAIGADRKVYATTNAGGQAFARTVALVALNTWAHIAAVFAAVDDRRVYLDGGNKVTDATSKTPAGIDTTSIGRRSTSAPALYASGRIAEVAIYNVALTDDEIAELATGASPLLVRPDALVAYWPLSGHDCPEQDLVGGFPMTLYPGSANTGATIVGTGGTAARAGSSGAGWNNVANVTADDAAYADHPFIPGGSPGKYTEWLTGTNLGFAIPAAATILGIVVEYEWRESFVASDWKNDAMQLIKGGTIQGDDKGTGNNIPNSWTIESFGGAADLWGLGWSAADLNAANFGVAFSGEDTAGSNSAVHVDFIRITVYYQDCASPADHPPVMFYPALDQCVIHETTDGINGKLIGHLATLGAGR
jgi:hypothetical protein